MMKYITNMVLKTDKSHNHSKYELTELSIAVIAAEASSDDV